MERGMFARMFGRMAPPGAAQEDDPRMAAEGLMDSDEFGVPAADFTAEELPEYSQMRGHGGPATQRYMDLDRDLELADVNAGYPGVHTAEETAATGLPDAYQAAQAEAALKGVQFPDLFQAAAPRPSGAALSDEEYRRMLERR